MLFRKKKQNLKTQETRCVIFSNEETYTYTLIRDNFATIRLRIRSNSIKTKHSIETQTTSNLQIHIENNVTHTTQNTPYSPFLIEVKAPHKCAQKYIDDFLFKKKSWIKQKIAEVQEKGTRPELDFSHGAPFFCLGRPFYFYYKHPLFVKNAPSFQKRVFGNTSLPWEDFAKLPIDACFEQEHIHQYKAHFHDDSHKDSHAKLSNPNNTQNSILAHITPRSASYDSYFLKEDSIYREFWHSSNNAHRNFSLLFQECEDINPPNTQVQIPKTNPYEANFQTKQNRHIKIINKAEKNNFSTQKYAFLCIKTKKEDFNLPSANLLKKEDMHKQQSEHSVLSSFSKKLPPFFEKFDRQNYATQDSVPHSVSKEYFQEKYEKSIRVWRKKSATLFLEICFNRVWQGLCGELKSASFQIPQEWQKHFKTLQQPRLIVKNLTRRFGSCATKPHPEITLAIHLIAFPIGLIEYVIIHEYCHLIYMNHSKNFYTLMEHCCPRSLQKRELLWEWSANHMQF